MDLSFPILVIGKVSWTEVVSVRTRDYKYIHFTGTKSRELYYDLVHDPWEQHNLAEARPERLAEAREVIGEHAAACERWHLDHPTTGSEAPSIEQQPGWLTDREAIDRKLRSLGYAE